MEITGITEKGVTEARWKSTVRSVVDCNAVEVRPGEVKTLGVWFQWSVCCRKQRKREQTRKKRRAADRRAERDSRSWGSKTTFG